MSSSSSVTPHAAPLASPALPASLAEQPSSVWRRLLDPLIDEATFDFWASHLNVLWTWSRPLARVVDIRPASSDAVTLWLQANRHWSPSLPGQHLAVSAEINGRRTTRCYSPVEIDARRRRLAITVKRVAGGKLSQHLCEYTRVGDVLELGPGFGAMHTPAAGSGPWIWLCAGSGITPMVSMLRELDLQGMPVDIHLLTWDRHRSQQCHASTLQDLGRRHPRLRVDHLLTGEAQLRSDEQGGRISAPTLDALLGPLPSLGQHRVYACGPHEFVETARQILRPHVREFIAESGLSAAPLASPQDSDATVRVQLLRTARSLDIPTDRPLLQALEEAGLRPRHGCRMGVCHTCVCSRESGSTQDLDSGRIDAEPGRSVRLCVARATSDLVLDL